MEKRSNDGPQSTHRSFRLPWKRSGADPPHSTAESTAGSEFPFYWTSSFFTGFRSPPSSSCPVRPKGPVNRIGCCFKDTRWQALLHPGLFTISLHCVLSPRLLFAVFTFLLFGYARWHTLGKTHGTHPRWEEGTKCKSLLKIWKYRQPTTPWKQWSSGIASY